MRFKKSWLKLIMIPIIMILGVSSCGTIKKIPIQTDKIIHYVDSTIITYKDSTIYVEVPKEVIKDVVPQYDTLKMETSLAKSVSYIDTLTHTLKGKLENKYRQKLDKDIAIPIKSHIEYRDSIIIKETPIEVEVEKIKYPKSYWYLLGWAILCIGYFAIKIYKKIKNV